MQPGHAHASRFVLRDHAHAEASRTCRVHAHAHDARPAHPGALLAGSLSAWMVLGPLGVWTSRYGRSLGAWFKIHKYSLGAASLFTFIGFWIAVTMGALDGAHWVSFHAKLGLLFFLVCA